jgi:catechol 2,3-dioxygenase-like lactoylglutathione lyase family enzyme
MLPVVNLEHARRFYEETLGLPLIDNLSAENALVFQCGAGTRLAIYRRAAPTKTDHTAAIWVVADIEDSVRKFIANGILFEQYDMPGLKTNELGIADIAIERTAWFKDPDGNILAIVQFVGP